MGGAWCTTRRRTPLPYTTFGSLEKFCSRPLRSRHLINMQKRAIGVLRGLGLGWTRTEKRKPWSGSVTWYGHIWQLLVKEWRNILKLTSILYKFSKQINSQNTSQLIVFMYAIWRESAEISEDTVDSDSTAKAAKGTTIFNISPEICFLSSSKAWLCL
jgi:hypothetical protein